MIFTNKPLVRPPHQDNNRAQDMFDTSWALVSFFLFFVFLNFTNTFYVDGCHHPILATKGACIWAIFILFIHFFVSFCWVIIIFF